MTSPNIPNIIKKIFSNKKGDFSIDQFGGFAWFIIGLVILLLFVGVVFGPKLLDLATSWIAKF